MLTRHRAKEKAAAAAAAQQEKKRESEAAEREKAAATTAGLLADPAQQRQLRERDAEISRLRDRLEAAAGELSEEQVHGRFPLCEEACSVAAIWRSVKHVR